MMNMEVGFQESRGEVHTSKQLYRGRLLDGRTVYLNGARVDDLAAHPSFAGAVDAIEQYYRLQICRPDIHLSRADQLGTVATSLQTPLSHADLARKRISYREVADISFGMLGRTPDFMNAAITALNAQSEVFGSGPHACFKTNIKHYYDRCAKGNLFVGHAAINPQLGVHASLMESQHNYAGVHVVGWNGRGIIVSGAKMIGTLAPLADELLIFNMPGLGSGDVDFAVAFSVPLRADGLTLVCRKSFDRPGYSRSDYPLSNRFDEIDSTVILTDVKIPWEDVFLFKDVRASNDFYDRTLARNHSGHQGIVRGIAKAEFAAGLALEIATRFELVRSSTVQEKLGTIASHLEVLHALVARCEAEATFGENGLVTPHLSPIQSFRMIFPKMYESFLEAICSFVPGSMLSAPSEADFRGPCGPVLAAVFEMPTMDAKRRAALLHLAWDLAGEGFGRRQVVYEYYHAGGPARLAQGLYRTYDWGSNNVMDLVS